MHRRSLINLLIKFLLLTMFSLANSACAETSVTYALAPEKAIKKNHVFIIYSPDSSLQSDISQKLTDNLESKRPNLIVSKVKQGGKITGINNDTDIIIGIGSEGMQSANQDYPETTKLFISTDPEIFRLDRSKNKNDAILYMTQSYCRQMQFIKLINDDWKVISLFNSQTKPVNTKDIKQCAKKYGLKIYSVNTSAEDNMTTKVKTALNNSDALLALPDRSVYNSNTVKNILLTSYRYRKPVIAFSRNFVNAGALASIHSSVEQVALSASLLIERYYELDRRFEKTINHPQLFDISINKQVFRALDLSPPDIDQLKQKLEQKTSNKPEAAL